MKLRYLSVFSLGAALILGACGKSNIDPVGRCTNDPTNQKGEYCCLVSVSFPPASSYKTVYREYWLVNPPDKLSYTSTVADYVISLGGKLVELSCQDTSVYSWAPTTNPCFWNTRKVVGGSPMNYSFPLEIQALANAYHTCKVCFGASPACNACANTAFLSTACAPAVAACNAVASCNSCVSCLDSGGDISVCGCGDSASQNLGACLLEQCPICAPAADTGSNMSFCWADPESSGPTTVSGGTTSGSSSGGTSTCQMNGQDCAYNTDCCSDFCIGASGGIMGTCG